MKRTQGKQEISIVFTLEEPEWCKATVKISTDLTQLVQAQKWKRPKSGNASAVSTFGLDPKLETRLPDPQKWKPISQSDNS